MLPRSSLSEGIPFHFDPIFEDTNETLIVWSESDSCDLALSFQEKSGCEEIWSKICEVQGKDPGEAEGGEELDEGELSEGGSGTTSSSKNGCSLPPVEMGKLPEIEFFLTNNVLSGVARERVSNAIESQGYIAKLCDLFKMCEDLENTKALKSLHNIAKQLFMLNKNSVIEMLVDDAHLREVVGMLEYDPVTGEQKPHREFLFEKARFRQILPMNNEQLKEKIHHVYRVQYVQDVCLPAPSLFEENHLSALNSYLFFYRVDIVTMIQEDKTLLKELFGQLKARETATGRRRELALFLKELCSMSSSLQQNGPQSKEAFYKTLVANDVLSAVEPCMRAADAETRATITKVLHMVVEYSPQTVREFILRQAKDKQDDEILLNVLLRHIATDRDPELSSATTMLQVLRMLLDPESMQQKGDKSDLLGLFYHRCLPTLTATLVENVEGGGRPKRDDYHSAKKLSLVLRLLNFCITHHALQMRSFTIRHDFLSKVLVLLNSKHHFLALYALKLLRSVIQQKDEFYYRYVVEKKVLDRVVECLVDNGRRNNLLNSAIIEIFEFMRTEDMKTLIAHVAERHLETLRAHSYVKTFAELERRYEQQKDREEQMRRAKEEGSSEKEREGRWKKERDLEKEEQWFEEDEEEEEDEEKEKKEETPAKPAGTPSPGRKSGAEPMFAKMKTSPKEETEEAGVFSGGAAGIKLSCGLASAPKIVIKVDGSRSRSPSPGAVPREDEVSSSQAASTSSSPVAESGPLKRPAPGSPPAAAPAPKKGLVEYDDSDSEEEEEAAGTSTDSADSLPSSSTGSPTREGEGEAGGGGARREREREREDDDVSSTSGDDDVAPRKGAEEEPSGKREGEEPADARVKRRRVEEPRPLSPRPSPPPVDPVAQ